MGLASGMCLGSCEIRESLGVGGMGEVWRAHDTHLGRDVAVKALPDEFAQDADRLARFEREAQVLAALNHPNLAIIHELKEVDGSKYLILELVEGETLAERIGRGPVPIKEALDIAVQIAGAVQAAHEKGIVHRDLKPANIKITPQGRVKVLDFGLAKIYESTSAPQHLSHSPTFAAEYTAEGVVLGTAAYMSPEQARGKEVDRRTDVWAFGCVVYEMLSGHQPFPNGETLSDTLAGILVHEPEWQALPAATPPKIRALMERCLRKDERRRIRDIGDARIALEESRSESQAIEAAAARPASSQRRERVFGVLTALFVLAAIGIASRLFFSPTPTARTVGLDTPVPLGMVNGFYISPDGRKLAFVTRAIAPARIWVRSLDSPTAEVIPSTEGITPPDGPTTVNSGGNNSLFWSLDSQYIAFVAEGKLKTVAATGGPAKVVATLPTGGNYFGTWGSNGVILLASDGPSSGPLLRVPASGGKLEPATVLDSSRMETSHRFPHFLPDGHHYLYLATGKDARDRVVYVGSLDSKDRHPLQGIAAEVKYSNGHLVFIRDGALMAQPFDLKRMELAGDAFPVADKFSPISALTWTFSASLNGILAYRASPDGGVTSGNAELAWYDSKGTRLSVAAPEGDYPNPQLSPDGKYVAFARGTPADIYWLDIEKKVTTKLTTDPGNDQNPRWSPDGRTIAFDSTREGGSGIYVRAIGLSGEDKLLLKSESAKSLTLSDWSRDGKYLVYVADNDIYALPVSQNPKTSEWTAGNAKPIQVTKTPFIESLPRISSDNRWIAYVSNQSNQTEVWIRSFPEPGTEQQVSAGAGGNAVTAQAQPHWSWDDKSVIYFAAGPIRFVSVGVHPSGTSLNAAAPMTLFGHPAPRAPFSTVFSVTRDGRFLMQVAPAGAPSAATLSPTAAGSTAGNNVVTIITNWAGNRKR